MNQDEFTIGNQGDDFEYEGKNIKRGEPSQVLFDSNDFQIAPYAPPLDFARRKNPDTTLADNRGRTTLRRHNMRLKNENAFLWSINYAILSVLAGIIGICAYWHKGYDEEEIKLLFAVLALLLSGRLNYKSHSNSAGENTHGDQTRK